MSTPDMILGELRRRGVHVRTENGFIYLRPKLSTDDGLIELIRLHKPEIIRELTLKPVTQPKPARPISCRYTWTPGYRFLRLYCVAHPHEIGASTVFRMFSSGHDVLAEMAALGILVAEALEDSRAIGQNPDQSKKEL